ncbi:patatin-like phospholipase family protein [Mesorhizobium sp. dw_380]|uniref:patatin-like phospholipase family protein n=1 Tax=Mesorhizobium sp. dw_380 TaxID=2812001 RepID=UPI001BDEF496
MRPGVSSEGWGLRQRSATVAGFAGAKPMTLDVWHHPDVMRLLGEIENLARQPEVDDFFWLRAAATENKAPSDADGLNLFEAAKAPDGVGDLAVGEMPAGQSNAGKVFRIANIVLQGGGVLGLAHAGFVTGLEQAGVRFVGIAGASAGAIMAMGMAAVRGDDLLSPTHKKVVEIVGAMPMATFIDGPYRTRRLIKQILLKRYSYLPSSWSGWLGAFRQILHTRGLNSGNAFEDWLRSVLAERGLRTVNDLFDRLRNIAEQLNKAIKNAKQKTQGEKTPLSSLEEVTLGGRDLLQIMAACTPIGVKFQFPDDIKYLSAQTGANSPAALVRASMSIPFFFEPAVFTVNKGEKWEKFIEEKFDNLADASKQRELSHIDEVAFLDGGIFSNLPVDAFSTILLNVPTIAVPLMNTAPAKPYRRRARLSSLADDISVVAFMVRNQRDRDAIETLERRKELFEKRQTSPGSERYSMPPSFPFRLAAINVKDSNWLNFVMDEKDMMDLFVMGLERARDFLEKDLKGKNKNG